MATFIPNITEIYRPPTPLPLDLDRVERMLRMRESMYQDGVKKVRTLYESAFNSQMLRDDNIQRRDQYLKLIKDGLKNVSGMDLSLTQNQNIASSLFQPVLEDENIVHDIAYTKNYQKELANADALRTSTDKETRRRYWDTGIKYMQYRAEEYKNADRQTALGMSAPKFVENVDMLSYAQEMFKESGISVKQDQASGNYIFTKKNGEAVYPIAQEYVNTLFAQDPAVKQMLQAQAYVQRKDFIKSNAEAYGGEYQAEVAYVTQNIKDQLNLAQTELSQNEKELQDAKNKLHLAKKMLEKNNVQGDQASQILQPYMEEISQREAVIEMKKKSLLEMSDISYDNIDDMRMAVDNAVAYNSYGAITTQIAKLLAYKDTEVTMKPDQFSLAEYRSNLSLQNAKVMESIRQANRISLKASEIAMELEDDKKRKELDLPTRSSKSSKTKEETKAEKKDKRNKAIDGYTDTSDDDDE